MEFLIGLLAVIGLLALLARLLGVPYPIFLRDEGKISAEVMRRVERDLDLEELRFSS
jgi:hypothetical protein